MKRLRFALIFNGNSLERWHVSCLDQLEELAELAGVIVAAAHPSPSSRGAGSMMRSYARRVNDRSTVDVTERFAHVPRLPADSVHSPGEDRAFDFVLRLGRVTTPPEVDSAARHGVWYFEHESVGDLLPFFREVYDGEDVTRAALLAFDARANGVAILEEGYFRTEKRSYVASRDRVLDRIATWPARVCRRLLAGADRDSGAPEAREIAPPRRPERPVGFLRFRAAIARRRLELAWERLFRHPQWNIGVLNVPVGALLAPGARADGEIDWFPLDDREGFLADPFGIVRDGRLHILCEYFDYREGKGHICALEYSGDGFTRELAPVLPFPQHMSYPFLVDGSDEIYCVPETSDANEVALFRAIEFPLRWSKIGVLVEDFPGIDPTVLSHDGRWWLMCTRRGAYEDVELWVWHASDLLGPWTPHAQNPVKTDVRCTRPGGSPFVQEGVLYRPTQDCSKTYGWRISVQRVLRLTPTEFAEEPVTVLEASPQSPFPHGRHTLTPVGDMVLVDGRRAVFAWPAFRAFLGIWAADLARKVRRE